MIGGCLVSAAAVSAEASAETPPAGAASDQQRGTAFPTRQPARRKELLVRGGGDQKTEAAVQLALEWLAANQAADGGWNLGVAKTQPSLVATTALSILSFLGAGHSPTAGPYKESLSRALAWLVAKQNKKGCIGLHKYESAIGLMAVAEAYGMSRDDKLGEAAQRAAKWARSSQCSAGGWDYKPDSERNDMSVTGWWIMGLKSAKTAGIKVSNKGWGQAEDFVKAMTSKRNGDVAYAARSFSGRDLRKTSGSARMPAVALCCLQFLGRGRTDSRVKACTSRVLKDGLPFHVANSSGRGRTDFYRWYYGTLGMYQLGGESEAWRKWNDALKKTLLAKQVRSGTLADKKGSWDPDKDDYGKYWGRAGQTALGALMLQVYYRYESVHEVKSEGGGK